MVLMKLKRIFHSGNHTVSTSIGLFILRVVPGAFMLACHGWGKLMGFKKLSEGFADPLGVGPMFSLILAIFAEVVCSVLVILGLGTRLAAIPLVILMVVAASIVHADDPWGRKEFALMYACAFLPLLFTGAGRFSLDYLLADVGAAKKKE